jgi:hypothetical protein
MYPSHLLLDPKENKLNSKENGLRFVKEEYYRYVTQTGQLSNDENSPKLAA